MIKKKKVTKAVSVVLSFMMVLSNLQVMSASDLDTVHLNENEVIGIEKVAVFTSESAIRWQSDFEDGTTWGFINGGGAEADVVEENGNKHLKLTGLGSGTRTITKTLEEPTNNALVEIGFDWRPGDVSTDKNSSEVLFTDINNAPIFRLVKQGGTEGVIGYEVGTTGIDISGMEYISGISTDNAWLSVYLVFDFKSESISLKISDKSDDTKSFGAPHISIKDLHYSNRMNAIIVKGNRSSGQTLAFETGLDNIFISTSEDSAPEQKPKNITTIVTNYKKEHNFVVGAKEEDVISHFPETLTIGLENNVHIPNVPVKWSTRDYDLNQEGTYEFIGELDIEGIPNVSNENNIQASVTVTTVKSVAQAPEIDGYDNLYYSDFGDFIPVTPPNWGFSTANATLSINEEDVGGNTSPKLQFTQLDQSGARVATKNLESPVNGDRILVTFDWYPGLLNDKGTNAYENGGEFRLIDSSGNTIFTLNNMKNQPLQYIVGKQKAVKTGFHNPDMWLTIEVRFDFMENELNLKLMDKFSGESEEYTSTLEGSAFDGTISALRLTGVRTSGNNVTWTTYLDNFGIYHISLPENRITVVDQIPYKRIYVDTALTIDEIGLPQSVTVTLADGNKADVDVDKWIAVDKMWDGSQAGVYTFEGILKESDTVENGFDRKATCYVYNRLTKATNVRHTEWLDRGVIALTSEDGIFISWRLLVDEYDKDIKFNVYRNDELLNKSPLAITNYNDQVGKGNDVYRVETILNGKTIESNQVSALENDYLSIPMQKPESGINDLGQEYSYSINDCSVGDLDGDGQYEVIVKWYPSNAIDSSLSGLTGPTIFDAYKLDGTPLWRMNMGLNLTSGAHYHQFLVFDFDNSGKSEFLVKTADATTVYGVTDGEFDEEKVISVIGNSENNGKWIYGKDDPENLHGKVHDGPEYISIFNGETGEVIDTIDYRFPVGDVSSWGDTWYNRSDRFLAGVAYLDGKTPSAIYGRGYYARTTYVAYDLIDGKLKEKWYFDSSEEDGYGEGMGFHSLATADLDNDGCDEIIAGSLVLDNDGSILYVMDGEMGRELGSHGDALHVGAFDPDREGIHIVSVHEESAVASLEYHDGATGETLMSYYASVDTGRGVAANITSKPGYEFWGTADRQDVEKGSGIYSVQDSIIGENSRGAGLAVNFKIYWDGDLLHELLDDVHISKFNEETGFSSKMRTFEGVKSSNGTKATPSLQGDILGDWREEVVLPTLDSTELRIYSTTIPTDYRLYTLMHDTTYRMGIAWQNVGYNQPPHIGFYLGEDIRDRVLDGQLNIPTVSYTNKPVDPEKPIDPEKPTDPTDTEEPGEDNKQGQGMAGSIEKPTIKKEKDGSVLIRQKAKLDLKSEIAEIVLDNETFKKALNQAQEDAKDRKNIRLDIPKVSGAKSYSLELPIDAIATSQDRHQLIVTSDVATFIIPSNLLEGHNLKDDNVVKLNFKEGIEISISINDEIKGLERLARPMIISIPYEASTLELDNYEHLVVEFTDEHGNKTLILNSFYDANTKMVTFSTDKLGRFEVSYIHKTFSDLENHQWAQESIEVLASKGIINGTSVQENTFKPGENISRADFMVLLIKTLGLTHTPEINNNFTDISPNAYYYESIETAKALGITSGVGDNQFNPTGYISRQDMMVLTANALAAIDKGLSLQNKDILAGFKDKDSISSYATKSLATLVDNNLIGGYDEKINPLGNSTRAETAVFMHRIFKNIYSNEMNIQ